MSYIPSLRLRAIICIDIDNLLARAFSLTAIMNGNNLSNPIPIDRICCKRGSTCLYSEIRFLSIWQSSFNIFSLRFSDLILENSATIFLGSYRQCFMLISTVTGLSGSSVKRSYLLNSSLNCLHSFMVCISIHQSYLPEIHPSINQFSCPVFSIQILNLLDLLYRANQWLSFCVGYANLS